MHRRKIEGQVIVITGASSGIGLATARHAAKLGARVVMVARSEEGLVQAAEEIRREGGKVTHYVADVADQNALLAAAEHAILAFGRIDTWVNNAGISVFGTIEDVALEDMRRLFDVTFWGVVHGCRAALPFLEKQGGALINVGAVESDLAIPMTGAYAAAKHAVQAFTDVLRKELDQKKAGVSVTLVKPASIDTPLFEHAMNYMEGDPAPSPPVYAPEVVARTIVACSARPVRDITVGGMGKFQVGLQRFWPRLCDRLQGSTMFQAKERAPRSGRHMNGALYWPHGTYGQERGDYPGRVMRSSAYTSIRMRPTVATLGLAVFGVLVLLGAWAKHRLESA